MRSVLLSYGSKWTRRELHPLPLACEASALLSELRAQTDEQTKCRPPESNRVLPLFRRTRGPPTPGRQRSCPRRGNRTPNLPPIERLLSQLSQARKKRCTPARGAGLAPATSELTARRSAIELSANEPPQAARVSIPACKVLESSLLAEARPPSSIHGRRIGSIPDRAVKSRVIRQRP